MVQQIEDVAAFDAALSSAGGKLVVVDFFATWCGPCKRIAPSIDELADSSPDIVVLKVDVDKAPALSEKYGVNAMPTFLYFKNGSKVHEVVGASLDKIKEGISSHK
eukprot:TRINITY_DN1748_c1_g1_i1.p2 TRINITY_DN1748_c1_g1~~TRINITY_DN1748_c1_g1_i1.p2  ORF type:complete len:106 (+),score=22.54 TRINITY_DN1748_c1_g1_i1:50-367(+)